MTPTSPLVKLGQCLTGTVSTYTVTRQLGKFIWLGRYLSITRLVRYLHVYSPTLVRMVSCY
jgi:hypothetical protein